MRSVYHILNGDVLKERFPREMEGEIIVIRECLVDGDVKSDNLEELFKVRARFIAELYGEYSTRDYFADTVCELNRIREIPEQSMVHLWFEDDLFCQVNFWFVGHLLFTFVRECTVSLIRPEVHTRFGFGGLSQPELLQAFGQRIQVTELEQIARLWESYQKGDMDRLRSTAMELKERYPFIPLAVEAHLARIPSESSPGRPVQTLLEIIEELGTDEFVPVFREFCKRESIYGFGDLQVKRLLDRIK